MTQDSMSMTSLRRLSCPCLELQRKAVGARRLLQFCIAILLTSGAMTVRGQSALDGFDPNANGTIRVVAVQTDGKILIGGDFTSLSPNGGAAVTRNRIARLNPDGTLDAAFNPNANNTVRSIAVQTDGKILVGGDFNGVNSIGGQTRNRIARLDATTGLADPFDPNASSTVFAIALQTDGKILVGGFFNNVGGQMRNRIARLDATTGMADSFDPNPNGPEIFAIVVQPNGKILAGGFFISIGAQMRRNIARLDPVTGLADSFNPDASDEVRCLAVQADGKVLAGGFFTLVGGQSRNSIARLDAITGAPDSFNPNANNGVFALAVQADGKILVGGDFFGVGGQSRHSIGRLDPATGLADSFDPNSGNTVNAIAVQADGKVLVGGGFTMLSPNGGASTPRNKIARLETDGRLDRTLNLNAIGNSVSAIAVQRDGKILIGGGFFVVLGVPRSCIARLNTDGTLDTGFNPNSDGLVLAIAVQADGKILVGGGFANIGGQTRNNIARLDSTTGLADSFNPNANDYVLSIAVQPDGRILAGGYFSGPNSIGGQARNRIARLDAATGLADSFNPNANDVVEPLALQPDGKILAGGDFTSIGGQTRNRIARLDPVTGLADTFDPNANDTVLAIAVQPDGKILAGGFFNGPNGIGGQTRNHIARLDATAGLADSFDPNATAFVNAIAVQSDGKILASGFFNGPNSIGDQWRNYIARLDASTGLADSFDPNASGLVGSIAIQADGKILVGGGFTGADGIGGQARDYFARLSNDTAALQSLTVSQSTITSARGGSSSQLTRVTFESSTDNMSYNLLGSGTVTGSNWILTGLSLPTGQNIYIRARGYYRGGYQSGSESITESVRNAFLTAPLQPTGAVSRKVHGDAGTFDIPLSLTGEPGVECRSTGGAYTLVFTFSNNVVSGNASVTLGAGAVSGSPIFSGNSMTVNLTGVTDAQKITVTLNAVTDSFAQVLQDESVSVNMLIGDVTRNKTVNSTDVSQTKLQSGHDVTVTNFREDVIPNGQINGTDVSQVRLRVGSAVP
jgi:uncharacterized delta-60 repeat protein